MNQFLENWASMDIMYYLLLLKFLLFHSMLKIAHSTFVLVRSVLFYDLDLVLFEILKAYGTLSCPKLSSLPVFHLAQIFDSSA